MSSDNIQAITVNRLSYDGNYGVYFRISIYEFRGEPLTAYFKEDLGVGSWDYPYLVEEARKESKSRKIIFAPNISMGDSVEKVWNEIYK